MSSNEAVNLNDNVRFGISTFHPSGSFLTDADETPRWNVYEDASDTSILTGAFTKRTLAGSVPGIYRGTFAASNGSGFEAGKYYEIHASGKVDDVVAILPIKSFVVNDIYRANIVQVSGQDQYAPGGFLQTNVHRVSGEPVQLADIVDANILQVSGEYRSIEDFRLEADVYYSDIKFIKDKSGINDEYQVCWFRNSQVLGSGDVSGPRINVIKTSDGSDLVADRTLNYIHHATGGLKYTETTNTAHAVSGEAYIVKTSGIIDGSYRQWKKIVGIDLLY